MNTHRKLAALLAAPLALFLSGCPADDVENAADKTADGLNRTGAAVQSAGKTVGGKLEGAGTGTKLENAANTTGKAIEHGGEKGKELLDKGADKLRDAGPGLGKAAENAEQKLKDLGHNAAEKAKDLKDKAATGLKKAGDAIKEEAKDIKKKVGDALDKDKPSTFTGDDKAKPPADDKND